MKNDAWHYSRSPQNVIIRLALYWLNNLQLLD